MPSAFDDEEHGFGQPTGGFQSQALQLSAKQAVAEESAMNYLRNALNKSPEVTPQQGIAAALLASIPTLGGYMIGNAVGRVKTPEGVYFKNPDTLNQYQTGGAAGGAMGAQLGGESSMGYLKSLEAQQAQRNKINEEMAQEESKRAYALGQEANQASMYAAKQQANKEMIPLEEASRIRIANATRQPREPSMWDQMSPEQRAANLAKLSGVQADGTPVSIDRKRPLDAAGQDLVSSAINIINRGESLASELEQIGGMAEYVKVKSATGLDPNMIGSRMKGVIADVVRAASGLTVTEQEVARNTERVFGDMTANPQQSAAILRNFLTEQRQSAKIRVNVAQRASDPDELLRMLDAPVISGKTMPAIGAGSPPPGLTPEQFLQWRRANRGTPK
jgi:hypothetical protein